MEILFVYLFIALFFSFVCSVLEAVILSVPPSFITISLQENKTFAKKLNHFKDYIDRPLAAILTLNTFAHTIGAAGVGAQAQLIWGNEYLSISSALLTIIILFFSEIIPKTIGANYWKKLVPATVYLLQALVFILYPFVVVSQLITRFLNTGERKSVLSRSEFSAMAEAGAKAGIFHIGESRIIQNIARFDRIQARDIMTPRTVLYAADESANILNFYETHPNIRFSRILLYKESLDRITGYVLKDELLIDIIEKGGKARLKSLKRKLPVVYVSLPIPGLYQVLMEKRDHIALVVDEYGGTAGIVTLEDVIETILGMEIVDEMDSIEDLRKAAREKWKERARRMGINAQNSP